MKRSPLLEAAHIALQDPDKKKVDELLSSVNLSKREIEVIIKSEIDKIDLESICNSFDNWGDDKHTICSYSHIVYVKRSGMLKIGRFLFANKMIDKPP